MAPESRGPASTSCGSAGPGRQLTDSEIDGLSTGLPKLLVEFAALDRAPIAELLMCLPPSTGSGDPAAPRTYQWPEPTGAPPWLSAGAAVVTNLIPRCLLEAGEFRSTTTTAFATLRFSTGVTASPVLRWCIRSLAAIAYGDDTPAT